MSCITLPKFALVLRRVIAFVSVFPIVPNCGAAQAEEMNVGDRADLSLDELLSTEITTLSNFAGNFERP